MSRSYSYAARYYDRARMIVRPYNAVTVMAKLYIHTTRYHYLALTMAKQYSDYNITFRMLVIGDSTFLRLYLLNYNFVFFGSS